MKTKTNSRVPAVPVSTQPPPFDAVGRRLVEPARILDNFVAPTYTGPELKTPTIPIQTERIHDVFDRWRFLCEMIKSDAFYQNNGLHDFYAITIRYYLGSKRFSSSEIAKFCLEMDRYKEDFKLRHGGTNQLDNFGLFLSALTNTSPDSNFTLYLDSLESEIKFIGYRNTKQLFVHGNLGPYLGTEMKSGFITVHGDVDAYTGDSMRGGLLTIHGNCTDISDLLGGRIIVNGKIEDFSGGQKGGDIFQFERQLVKDGIQIADPENGT